MRPPARRKPVTPPQSRRGRRGARGVAGAAVPSDCRRRRDGGRNRGGWRGRSRSRTPEPGHRATGRAATGAVRRATASGQPDSNPPASHATAPRAKHAAAGPSGGIATGATASAGKGAAAALGRPGGRGRDAPARKIERKLYNIDAVVDRGFEDVEEEAGTRRVHWTILKRTVADQISRKPMSTTYVLQREGADSEFPSLGAARDAVHKKIVHPEKLTRSKAEYAAEKK